MDCILCDRTISADNDSEEHVLPNAIGGRLKVAGVLCRVCNGWTGSEWDSALCEQLNWFSLILGITRERGEPPAMQVTTVDGQQLRLLPDGSMTPRHPTFKQKPLSETSTALHIVARDHDDARTLLKQAAQSFPSLDVTSALEQATHEHRYLTSPIQLSLLFGGPRTGRSVVKTALVFAAHKGIDAKTCLAARRYLRAKDAHPEASQAIPPFSPLPVERLDTDLPAEPPFDYFYAQEILIARPDRPLHGIAISSRGTQGQLLAYVEYFEGRRCLVCLAENYDGPEVHTGHFIDPVAGETVDLEFDLALSRSEVGATLRGERHREDQMLAAFSLVLNRALRIAHERERNRVVTAALEEGLAACGIEPDQEMSAEHIAVVTRTLAERLAPLMVAQRRAALGLPPGIAALRTDN